MHPANERQYNIVTASPIGWAHTQNDPCSTQNFCCTKASPDPIIKTETWLFLFFSFSAWTLMLGRFLIFLLEFIHQYCINEEELYDMQKHSHLYLKKSSTSSVQNWHSVLFCRGSVIWHWQWPRGRASRGAFTTFHHHLQHLRHDDTLQWDQRT